MVVGEKVGSAVGLVVVGVAVGAAVGDVVVGVAVGAAVGRRSSLVSRATNATASPLGGKWPAVPTKMTAPGCVVVDVEKTPDPSIATLKPLLPPASSGAKASGNWLYSRLVTLFPSRSRI